MVLRIIAFIMLWSVSEFGVGQAAAPKKVMKKKTEKVRDGDFVKMDTTNLNFGEEQIEGRIKSPEGFFLRGRSAQELLQMVNLRSDFRPELKTTKNGAVALTR